MCLPGLTNRLIAVAFKTVVLLPENVLNTGNARDCCSQAFKNGIEVLTPIVIAHAKDHSDVDQMLTRNQIMEYASKDNYDDLCVDSAHIDSLLPLLQGMHY